MRADLAQLGWRAAITGADDFVEAPQRGETGGQRDLGHRQLRVGDHLHGALDAPGLGDFDGGGAEVVTEQAGEVAGADAAARRQGFYRAVSIQCASVDEFQGAFDRGFRAVPGRAEGGAFGAAFQTGAVPGAFGSSGAGEEIDVAGERLAHAADRAAINAGGSDGDEEDAVVRRIAGEPRGVHGVEIETVYGGEDGSVHGGDDMTAARLRPAPRRRRQPISAGASGWIAIAVANACRQKWRDL